MCGLGFAKKEMKNPIDKLKEMEKRLAFNENKETISLENVEKKIQNNSELLKNFGNVLTNDVLDAIMMSTVEQPFNRILKGELQNMNVFEKKNTPVCEHEEVHDEKVRRRREEMPDEETIYDLSDFFKIFGDSTRMSILFALDGEPMCVCDIAALLGMTKSAVSHQLKVLRQSDIITYRKSGKNVIYSLADDHVRDIIEKALEHVKE